MKLLKKGLSLLLALIMVVSVLPMQTHAASDTVWNGSSTATAFAGGTGTSSRLKVK